MKTPCELVVKTVLPTIRASIARELVETHGMSQKKTAETLGITTAAVSQYLSKKRATKRDLKVFRSEEFKKLMKKTAEKIAKAEGETEAMTALCQCCLEVRGKGLLRQVNQEISPGITICDPRLAEGGEGPGA